MSVDNRLVQEFVQGYARIPCTAEEIDKVTPEYRTKFSPIVAMILGVVMGLDAPYLLRALLPPKLHPWWLPQSPPGNDWDVSPHAFALVCLFGFYRLWTTHWCERKRAKLLADAGNPMLLLDRHFLTIFPPTDELHCRLLGEQGCITALECAWRGLSRDDVTDKKMTWLCAQVRHYIELYQDTRLEIADALQIWLSAQEHTADMLANVVDPAEDLRDLQLSAQLFIAATVSSWQTTTDAAELLQLAITAWQRCVPEDGATKGESVDKALPKPATPPSPIIPELPGPVIKPDWLIVRRPPPAR